MKKGCIGCLGSLVILLLAGFGALLYFGPAYGREYFSSQSTAIRRSSPKEDGLWFAYGT